MTKSIKDLFKVYPDFPKPGINFLDINSVTSDANSLMQLHYEMSELVWDEFTTLDDIEVDKVVAIESRGFLLAGVISDALACGFVMARKPGKLPGEIISQSYGTEYSDDKLEMQTDSIKPGDKVLIHDDILATGGTALAVAKMVESLGGIVVGYLFIGEIEVCKGRELLGNKVVSLVTF